jgi:hypothetical protein
MEAASVTFSPIYLDSSHAKHRIDFCLSKVNGMVDSMVKERSLTKADGEKIKNEAEKLSVW